MMQRCQSSAISLRAMQSCGALVSSSSLLLVRAQSRGLSTDGDHFTVEALGAAAGTKAATSSSTLPTPATTSSRGGSVGKVSMDGEFTLKVEDLDTFKTAALQESCVSDKLEAALDRLVEAEKALLETGEGAASSTFEGSESSSPRRQSFGHYFDRFVAKEVFPYLQRKGWDQNQWVQFTNQVVLQLREGQEAQRSQRDLHAKDAIDRQCRAVVTEYQQAVTELEAERAKVYDREPRSKNFSDMSERDKAMVKWRKEELEPLELQLDDAKARAIFKRWEMECKRTEIFAHQKKAEYFQYAQFVARYLWQLIALFASMLVMAYSTYWNGRRLPMCFEARFTQLQQQSQEMLELQEKNNQRQHDFMAEQLTEWRRSCERKDDDIQYLQERIRVLETEKRREAQFQHDLKMANEVAELRARKSRPWWKFW